MRYINLHFTYLLTYLLTLPRCHHYVDIGQIPQPVFAEINKSYASVWFFSQRECLRCPKRHSRRARVYLSKEITTPSGWPLPDSAYQRSVTNWPAETNDADKRQNDRKETGKDTVSGNAAGPNKRQKWESDRRKCPQSILVDMRVQQTRPLLLAATVYRYG